MSQLLSNSNEWLKEWLSTIITGLANFSTQYNFQSIAITFLIMSSTICTSDDGNCKDGNQAAWVDSFGSAAIFLGAIVGQLSMGYLGDYFSRNYALIITMLITSISAMMTASSSAGTHDAKSIYATIIFFRFTLGIGAGGVYPLTATKASEDSSHTKGKMNSTAASWSFFWQMPALVTPWLIGYLLTYNSEMSVSAKWRLVLGLGAIPPFLCIFLLLLESHMKQQQKRQQQQQGSAADIETSANLLPVSTRNSSTPSTLQESPATNENLEKSGRHSLTGKEVLDILMQDSSIRNKLLISGGTWFLYNVMNYGISLIAGNIIHSFSDDDDNISSNHALRQICSKQMIALSLSTPATLFSIFILPFVGLKMLQTVGFSIISICMCFLAIFFYPLHNNHQDALFALYCFVSMSLNIGVGITTYALPATLFPKRIRATFNGMAAAMGKVGAFCGSFTFHLMSESIGYSWITGVCAFIGLSAAILTALFINSSDILTEDTNESDDLLNLSQLSSKGSRTASNESSSSPTLKNDKSDSHSAIGMATISRSTSPNSSKQHANFVIEAENNNKHAASITTNPMVQH